MMNRVGAMDQRQRVEVDGALMDALASYAMALQELLRDYVDDDECRCPDPCRRCEGLSLLDGDA